MWIVCNFNEIVKCATTLQQVLWRRICSKNHSVRWHFNGSFHAFDLPLQCVIVESGRFNCLQLFLCNYFTVTSRSVDWISRVSNDCVIESLTKSSSFKSLLFVSLNFLIFLVFPSISNILDSIRSLAALSVAIKTVNRLEQDTRSAKKKLYLRKDTFGSSFYDAIGWTHGRSDLVTTSFLSRKVWKL